MITLAQIAAAWNRFFHTPQSPLPIAAFRILFGLAALANQLLILPDVMVWFSQAGTLPADLAKTLSGGRGLNLFDFLSHSDSTVWLIYGATCLSAATLALGLGTRVSAIVLWATLVTLHHRNPVVLNSGDTWLRVSAFLMIFAPAGRAWSVDRWLRLRLGREAGPPAEVAPWAMRLIQLQISFLYLYAWSWKMMGGLWLNGSALYYTSRLQEFWRFPVPYVFEHMWTIRLGSWATLLIEFAMGALIWIKELRYPVLLAGLLLHLAIDYSMNIPLFGFIVTSAYVTFVEPRHLERLASRFSRSRGS